MKLNKSKYIQILFYILSQSYNKPHFGKTVLCTILYFIDFNYYEIYGELLMKETYVKSKKGIEPKHFHEITEELISRKQLFLRKENYYNRKIHKYYLLIIPNVKLNENELKVINSSINRLIDNNASTISKYAKKDPPVNMANLGDNLECKYVSSRDHEYSFKKINKFINS